MPAKRTRTVTVRPARSGGRRRGATRSARKPSVDQQQLACGRRGARAPTARPSTGAPAIASTRRGSALAARSPSLVPIACAEQPLQRGRRRRAPARRWCGCRSPCSRSRVTAPTPHDELDRERIEEGALGARLDDDDAVGLGDLRRDLGEVLGGGDADRHGEAELVADAPADLGRDDGGRAEQVHGARDVEERLVDRDALDPRREVAQHVDDLVAEPLVLAEVAADEPELGAQPPGAPAGHARAARRSALASYDAASTTPPPTAMGRPRRVGSRSCSTDA